MLDKLKKRLRALTFFAVALIPVIAAVRIVIVVTLIDPNSLLFERNTVVPDVFNGVVYALAVFMILASFSLRLYFYPARRKKLSPEADELIRSCAPRAPSTFWSRFEKGPDSAPLTAGSWLVFENTYSSTVFASTITGFMFVASAILMGGSMLIDSKLDLMTSVTLIAAILSGLYFLFSGMKHIYVYSGFFCVLSMMPTVWCCLRLISGFMDLSQNSNEYSHVLQIALLVTLTTFFFNEGRFTLSDPSVYSFALYVGSGLASLILIAAMSVPNLLLISFWLVGFSLEVFNSLVEFMVAVYIVARLVTVIRKLARLRDSDVSVGRRPVSFSKTRGAASVSKNADPAGAEKKTGDAAEGEKTREI